MKQHIEEGGKMDKTLLKELIEDIDDCIGHTAGETKHLLLNIKSHLRTELTMLEAQQKAVEYLLT